MSKTDRPSAAGDSERRDAVVSCWMCGVCRHSSQMVPDGGNACDDIRWYCNDAQACTQRWTTSRHTLDQIRASNNDGGTEAASQADQIGAVRAGLERMANLADMDTAPPVGESTRPL